MNPSKDQLVHEAWKRGLLSWKLYKHQVPIYNACWSSIINHKSNYVVNVSRRFGKTTILCLIAIEFAIRFPETQIRFAAPTAKQLKKAIRPIMRMLLKDCPDDIKPQFKDAEDVYIFQNGSELHTAGTDADHSENLRGQVSHLNIMDEAAAMDNLDYVMRSILMPQTLTTNGTTLLASTPPPVLDHDYVTIAHEAKERGDFIQFTVHDNKSLSKEQFQRAVEDSGGEQSTHFKREYLCQFLNDEEHTVIPEWDNQYVQDIQRDDYYKFYHKYAAMDLGVRDNTACLFGYYDFRKATLIIEDEITMNGPDMTTEKLAMVIKDKEKQLWDNNCYSNDRELDKTYRRIADNNNLLLLQDLATMYELHFIPTTKTKLVTTGADITGMVNETRVWVGQGRLIINPRCKMLIGCLQFGVWSRGGRQKNEFARSSTYKHYDHLAALIYLIRNLDTYTNPVPPLYGIDRESTFIITNNQPPSNDVQILSEALSRSPRRLNK